jgi:hypothetical protein
VICLTALHTIALSGGRPNEDPAMNRQGASVQGRVITTW